MSTRTVTAARDRRYETGVDRGKAGPTAAMTVSRSRLTAELRPAFMRRVQCALADVLNVETLFHHGNA